MYTTSSIFFKTLAEVGITHVFVNWGSDHPGMLEELAQRSQDGMYDGMRIVTCPNEMAGLSAAQGYVQVTGKPAAVIIHVDVGTQALAQAVHSLDRSNTPILIYAGAAPFSTNGELRGSRNEWIMWGQDVRDQPAIVRQYMRAVMQIDSGVNMRQIIKRGLQIATSDPKGPVYLWARREVMEEEINESAVNSGFDSRKWAQITCSAISRALCSAKSPLIISQYIGRNPRAVDPLQKLSRLLAVPVFASCPTAVCVPFSDDNLIGLSFTGHTPLLEDADVVLVVEADIPWIPARSKPKENARVFVIGCDPLMERVGRGLASDFAEMICKADAEIALTQILEDLEGIHIDKDILDRRSERVKEFRTNWLHSLEVDEIRSLDAGPITVPQLLGSLRDAITAGTTSAGKNVLVMNESITAYGQVWSHLKIDKPQNMLCSGSSALGWALGAAVGAKLANEHELVVAVVGDGCFIFSNPSACYWMSRRYKAPFLTIVLNNGGWNSPRKSMESIYSNGQGVNLSSEQLTIGFGPCADYGGIAAAAGGAWSIKVEKYEDLYQAIVIAIEKVKEGVSAVVDCVVQRL